MTSLEGKDNDVTQQTSSSRSKKRKKKKSGIPKLDVTSSKGKPPPHPHTPPVLKSSSSAKKTRDWLLSNTTKIMSSSAASSDADARFRWMSSSPPESPSFRLISDVETPPPSPQYDVTTPEGAAPPTPLEDLLFVPVLAAKLEREASFRSGGATTTTSGASGELLLRQHHAALEATRRRRSYGVGAGVVGPCYSSACSYAASMDRRRRGSDCDVIRMTRSHSFGLNMNDDDVDDDDVMGLMSQSEEVNENGSIHRGKSPNTSTCSLASSSEERVGGGGAQSMTGKLGGGSSGADMLTLARKKFKSSQHLASSDGNKQDWTRNRSFLLRMNENRRRAHKEAWEQKKTPHKYEKPLLNRRDRMMSELSSEISETRKIMKMQEKEIEMLNYRVKQALDGAMENESNQVEAEVRMERAENDRRLIEAHAHHLEDLLLAKRTALPDTSDDDDEDEKLLRHPFNKALDDVTMRHVMATMPRKSLMTSSEQRRDATSQTEIKLEDLLPIRRDLLEEFNDSGVVAETPDLPEESDESFVDEKDELSTVMEDPSVQESSVEVTRSLSTDPESLQDLSAAMKSQSMRSFLVQDSQDLSVQDSPTEDFSAKDTETEDLSLSVLQDQDLSIKVYEEQDLSSSVLQDQDLSIKVYEEQDLSVQHSPTEDFSTKDTETEDFSFNVFQDQDLSIMVYEEQDLLVEGSQTETLSMKDSQERNLSVNDSQENRSTKVSQGEVLSIPDSRDHSIKDSLAEDLSLGADLSMKESQEDHSTKVFQVENLSIPDSRDHSITEDLSINESQEDDLSTNGSQGRDVPQDEATQNDAAAGESPSVKTDRIEDPQIEETPVESSVWSRFLRVGLFAIIFSDCFVNGRFDIYRIPQILSRLRTHNRTSVTSQSMPKTSSTSSVSSE